MILQNSLIWKKSTSKNNFFQPSWVQVRVPMEDPLYLKREQTPSTSKVHTGSSHPPWKMNNSHIDAGLLSLLLLWVWHIIVNKISLTCGKFCFLNLVQNVNERIFIKFLVLYFFSCQNQYYSSVPNF